MARTEEGPAAGRLGQPDPSAGQQRERAEPRNWVAAHTTLVLSVAASGLIVLRIFGAADFDIVTALGILSAAGTASVLVGAFLTLVPFLLIVVGWILIPLFSLRAAALLKARDWTLATWAASFVLLLIYLWAIWLPVFLFALSVVPALVLVATQVGSVKRDQSLRGLVRMHLRGWVARLRGAERYGVALLVLLWTQLIVTVLLTSALLLFGATVWLPSEKVRTDSRELVGFVLEDSGEWTTLLQNEPRRISHIPARQIRTRTICTLPGSAMYTRTLAEILGGIPPVPLYPECGEA